MTSPAQYEAALCQLEDDPPDICQCNANIREERWSNFSLEGVRFPAVTVDVIQRGEALAAVTSYVRTRSHYSFSTDLESRSPVYSSIARRSEENS